MSEKGIILKDVETDLIDQIWTKAEGRPEKPNTPIKIHDIKYAGRTWIQKVDDIRARITQQGADLFVVTSLDEVACMLFYVILAHLDL